MERMRVFRSAFPVQMQVKEETAGLLLLLLRQEIILLSFACDSLFLVSPPDSPDAAA